MFSKKKLSLVVASATALLLQAGSNNAFAAEKVEEVLVIGITPGSASTLEISKVPYY